MNSAEQYLLELMNRARLDPTAEVRRQGDGIFAVDGVASTAPRQVLAPSDVLQETADNHTDWMFRNNTFSHVGAGGQRSLARAEDLGFYGRVGENLSWRPGHDRSEAGVEAHFAQLWASSSHQPNMLQGAFREVGLTVQDGLGGYAPAGESPASIMTQVFGREYGTPVFVTGVAYTDRDRDAFYSMGEGREGIRVTSGRAADTTEAAGGYAIGVGEGAAVAVDLVTPGQTIGLTVNTRAGNVKIDLVNGARLDIAGSFDLQRGEIDIRMIGTARYNASGSDRGDAITGNRSANRIAGEDGWDRLSGGDGNDTLLGGTGKDMLYGNAGNDRLSGDRGDDQLFGSAGSDKLVGALGTDSLTGGGGADQFIFTRGGGRDVVLDLSARDGDRIVLDDAMWTGAKTAGQVIADHARMAGGKVILDFGDGGVVELRGVTSTAGLAGLIDII